MNALVTQDELALSTGYTRAGDIEKCLRKQGVRVLYGRGGKIFTTTDAINVALGLSAVDDKPRQEEIEIV